MNPGESIRVFPLSNWTELDVWEYIDSEKIPVVPLYFARPRPWASTIWRWQRWRHLGSLDTIKNIVTVNGYVNCVAGFADSPKVINGASDLFVEIFGDAGRHVRAAVGVTALPRNALVELQISVQI